MDAFTEEMKAELLKEREELLRKLNNEGADFRSEAMASSGRGDSSDLASDEGAYRKMEAMNALDAKKLRAVENALKRISDGKYGYCLQCGKKIPEGRLRAIPEAVLCVDCKSAPSGEIAVLHCYHPLQNGFDMRSVLISVIGPCPGITSVSSGSFMRLFSD